MSNYLKKPIVVFFVLFLLTTAYAEDNPDTSTKNTTNSSSSGTDTASGLKSGTAHPKKPLNEMEKLQQEIKALEEKINKMSEENDIRRRLETTAEEKSSSDETILSAAGRDYTLMKPGNLGFELNVAYTGDAYDGLSSTEGGATTVEHNAYHSLTTGFYIEYPVKENLTVTANIPFVYKYSSQTNTTTTKDTSDLGDVSFGCQLQPVKSGGDLPSIILSSTFICPTGRSPYKIDTTREMSTGNGAYGINAGLNMSKSVDPVVVFGGMQYSHYFDINKLHYQSEGQGESNIYLQGVRPGSVFSYSMGVGYSLSYKVSMVMAYQYSYQSKTSYDWSDNKYDSKSEGSISSDLSIGTGWNITPKKSVNVKVEIGLTSNDPAFTVSVRIPFTYVL